MAPTLLIIAAVVVVLGGLLLLAVTQLVLLTYGWALPLVVFANALAFGWAVATGNLLPPIGVLAFTVFAFYGHFRREQRRVRILAHCIAALFSEATTSGRCAPDQLFAGVYEQIAQDFWIDPLDSFARRDALLFREPHLLNGGFPGWYSDLHRRIAAEWFEIKTKAAARDRVEI